MRLFIACLIIYGLHLHWALFVVAAAIVGAQYLRARHAPVTQSNVASVEELFLEDMPPLMRHYARIGKLDGWNGYPH